MSLTNDQITAKNFKDFYNQIRPYLNGEAHAGFTPVGTVISVMGKTAPQNYLVCDGTAYNIADYPELAAYFLEQFESVNFFGGDGTTTFAVPDLRGEFLRGTGTNSHANQGSGGEVGVHQDGTTIPNLLGTDGRVYVTNNEAGTNNQDSKINASSVSITPQGTSPTSSDWFEFTSRPTNTSILFCIAVKNIFNDASEGQAEVMPIASVNYKDRIVQYVGATNATYINGFFYKCIEDSSVSPTTYSWEPVNTQDKPEALSSSDMADIKAAFSGMNQGAPLRMMNYSTDEQVVGTWIDGKPIYQKTLTGNNPLANSTPLILNVDTVINVFGSTLLTSANIWFQYPFATGQNDAMRWELSNNNITYVGIRTDVSKYKWTFQYTKTTD